MILRDRPFMTNFQADLLRAAAEEAQSNTVYALIGASKGRHKPRLAQLVKAGFLHEVDGVQKDTFGHTISHYKITPAGREFVDLLNRFDDHYQGGG